MLTFLTSFKNVDQFDSFLSLGRSCRINCTQGQWFEEQGMQGLHRREAEAKLLSVMLDWHICGREDFISFLRMSRAGGWVKVSEVLRQM